MARRRIPRAFARAIERGRILPVIGGDGAVVVYLRLLDPKRREPDHASANAADGLDVVPERALRPGSLSGTVVQPSSSSARATRPASAAHTATSIYGEPGDEPDDQAVDDGLHDPHVEQPISLVRVSPRWP